MPFYLLSSIVFLMFSLYNLIYKYKKRCLL
nr:MAG TPA: resistance to inhibitors of cholinesterase-like protein [Caudoviricetes sp.]DAT87208.1 MAG TPA: resistance to inhibitors of cholinesterase-like protein [Caudoviricetes sp.]